MGKNKALRRRQAEDYSQLMKWNKMGKLIGPLKEHLKVCEFELKKKEGICPFK